MSVDVVTIVQGPTPVVDVVQQGVAIVEVVQVGPQGPAGPPGGAIAPYVQSTPLATWTIPNPFAPPYLPDATVLDAAGHVILPDIDITASFITITFSTPTAGTVVIS